MYNIKNKKDRERIVIDADRDGDACPVDAICDSIPEIVNYINTLENIIKDIKTELQKANADVNFYRNKLNNVKSQKFRYLKKKGKI